MTLKGISGSIREIIGDNCSPWKTEICLNITGYSSDQSEGFSSSLITRYFKRFNHFCLLICTTLRQLLDVVIYLLCLNLKGYSGSTLIILPAYRRHKPDRGKERKRDGTERRGNRAGACKDWGQSWGQSHVRGPYSRWRSGGGGQGEEGTSASCDTHDAFPSGCHLSVSEHLHTWTR